MQALRRKLGLEHDLSAEEEACAEAGEKLANDLIGAEDIEGDLQAYLAGHGAG
jgi:hypothetical protein